MPETYYKLLRRHVDGTLRSCHGGDAVWPEPQRIGFATYEPGAPVMAHATPDICTAGVHLTTDPLKWLTVMDVECYVAEPVGPVRGRSEAKVVFDGARLIEPVEIPWWWREVEAFVASIPSTPWMQRVAPPRPEWRVFASGNASWNASRAASRNASWNASWAVSWAASWAVSWDASLLAQCLVCGGLDLDPRYLAHARARWDVWQRGYGLLCDVDGVLYVYEAIG